MHCGYKSCSLGNIPCGRYAALDEDDKADQGGVGPPNQGINVWCPDFASYATPIGQLVLCIVEEPDSIYQKTGLSAETTSYPACPIFAFLLGFRMAPHFSTNPHEWYETKHLIVTNQIPIISHSCPKMIFPYNIWLICQSYSLLVPQNALYTYGWLYIYKPQSLWFFQIEITSGKSTVIQQPKIWQCGDS